MDYLHEIDPGNVPEHVAVIMDGNGRWAKERGKVRVEGHKEGSKNLKKVMDAAIKCGVKYMTVYAFSTENWSRPKTEVTYLMNLLRQGLKRYRKDAMEGNIRISVIGDTSRLDKELQEQIADIIRITKEHTNFHLVIAINYGGRDELKRTITSIGREIQEGRIEPENITDELIESYLDTASLPDPDLLIRTSGEQRLSNYLLWQLAYAEFYFTDVKWPDFNAEEFYKAIYYYQNRNRRFGSL